MKTIEKINYHITMGDWPLFVIIFGSPILTYLISVVLELDKMMKSAQDELIYLPIIIICVFIMGIICFYLHRFWDLIYLCLKKISK